MIATALAIAMAAPAALDRPHHVYVYGAPNRSYECPPMRFYIGSDGHGYLFASRCVQLSVDWEWWPDFPLLDLHMELATVKHSAPIVGDCSFVGHALAGNGTSSTVIDCR